MGGTCSKIDEANWTNNKKAGMVPDCETTSIKGIDACLSSTGLTGNKITKLGKEYCNYIGAEGEWIYLGMDGEKCHYPSKDRNRKRVKGTGCCHGNCIVLGGKGLRGHGIPNCLRAGYTADKSLCCFMDYACNAEQFPDSCFQTPQRQRTCGPEYRDLSSSTCQEEIFDYCVGNKQYPGQNHWLDLWLDEISININAYEPYYVSEEGDNIKDLLPSGLPFYFSDASGKEKQNFIPSGWEYDFNSKREMKAPCKRALARALSSKVFPGGCTWEDIANPAAFRRGTFSKEGTAWGQRLINGLVEKGLSEFGSFVGSVNQKGQHKTSLFNELLWDICNVFPILCKQSLKNICSGVTKENISIIPEGAKWCGCYMPDKEYEKYSLYGIGKECTPFCNQEGNIKLVDPDNYVKRCLSDLCIIDDVSLNFVRTTIGSDASFTQICGGCGEKKIDKEIDGINDIGEENIIVDFYSATFNSAAAIGEVIRPINEQGDYFYSEGQELYIFRKDGTETKTKVKFTIETSEFFLPGQGNLKSTSLGKIIPVSQDDEFKYGEEVYVVGKDSAQTEVSFKLITGKYSYHKDISGSDYKLTSNRCTCILEGDFTSVDAEFNSLNLISNCGMTTCYEDGNTVTCSGENSEEIEGILAAYEKQNGVNKTKSRKLSGIILGLISLVFLFSVVIVLLAIRFKK